jgi:hypothetical protein
MLISIYSNKSLIYLFIYCVFKFIFYIALTKYFSSFLYPLYLISISKIFTFLLYKIKFKIQSIENNENISRRRLENQEVLINNQQNNNNNNLIVNNGRRRNSNRRKKILSWIVVFSVSILELIFYGLFNKVHDEDSNKRGYFYLMNNKLFFLSNLSVLYIAIFKKYRNKHNILAIIALIISQIGIYFTNYINIFENSLFLIYSFFMNIIYSLQNFFEKKLIEINDNHEKHTMYIISEEGILELLIVVILTIAVKWYFGSVPTMPFLNDYTLTIKFIFLALCILLTEFIRMDALYKYNPFYICFFEEIIYIGFFIYNTPEKEITYIIFHLINIFAFLVFIEIIELNFCGLNQRTERFIRERELDRLNNLIGGLESASSSLSTGSNSGGNIDIINNNNNNQDQGHEIILNDDLLNLDIFDNNYNNNILLDKDEIDNEILLDDKKEDEVDKGEVNLEKIFDDD